jgi:hypothetical protein
MESMFEYGLLREWHGWRNVLWFQLLIKLSRRDPLIGLTLFGYTVGYGPRLKPCPMMTNTSTIAPAWADEGADIVQTIKEIKEIKERLKR